MLDILDVAVLPPPLTTFLVPPARSTAHPTKSKSTHHPFKYAQCCIQPSLHTLYLGSDQSTCSTKLPSAGVAYEIFSLNRNG